MPQFPSEGILRSDPTEACGVRPLGEIADAFVPYVTHIMWEANLKKGGGGDRGLNSHKKVLLPL